MSYIANNTSILTSEYPKGQRICGKRGRMALKSPAPPPQTTSNTQKLQFVSVFMIPLKNEISSTEALGAGGIGGRGHQKATAVITADIPAGIVYIHSNMGSLSVEVTTYGETNWAIARPTGLAEGRESRSSSLSRASWDNTLSYTNEFLAGLLLIQYFGERKKSTEISGD